MMVIFCLFFMTPLLIMNNMMLTCQFVFIILLMFFIMNFNIYSFFSYISYNMGVDNISYFLIILSFVICSLMILSLSNSFNLNSFLFLVLLLMFLLYMIFCSLISLFMYIYIEFILIPLMVMILGWGYQPERLLAGLYLFFYTLFASLPLFLLIMMIYLNYGLMFLDSMHFMNINMFFMYLSSILAFLVKFPMYMFHFWLPKAHVQAPVFGSMILAGLTLKIGGYGLIRLMMMFEYMYMSYSYIWFSLSMYGSLIVGLICLVQGDIKCLIAYSSVSHMGMCLMGLMTMTWWGLLGSYLLMIGHGFCSSCLFYMSNILYTRTGSRSFFINKGMLYYMPGSAFLWFIFCLFNMSCPPSINFISEVFIITSMMNYWLSSMIYFVMISFLSACFSYYLFSYTHHGLYHSLYSHSSMMVKEYLNVMLHLFPLMGFLFMLFYII
uniref:NADH-ubiquinone oxidoreductase chain 4 n=1 Tax=Fieberiella septentrionalis TaxID=1978376 RepID=A0A890CBY5_9HEMI|nr:NADH dehydrogenase subunit 4 [Fieberiella septentrionalis]QRG29274.1 NADH dehydrogenase subunit 4 [Fieberiella septentrionalis]